VAPRLQSYELLADEILDRLQGKREIDFVTEVSALLPIWIIADMLGIPKELREQFFQWTNKIIGAGDPEFRDPDASPVETSRAAIDAQFAYFNHMVEERRRHPTGDITSILANARLDDGQPLPLFELFSYLVLLVVAGNETTRNAASGGLLALIENPGELEKLRRNPELLGPAVEEIVRWVTPVIQFCRTPRVDVEIRGQKIEAGEHLCLFYPSANRDEDVFVDPFTFRIERHPNRHLAFGIGEHACLGANLARTELKAIFGRLLARLQSIELAGPVERLRSSFVGGIKHMPVRLELRA
jgi:cytochrome P450